MATVTRFIAYFEDGAAFAGYDYSDSVSDANRRVLRAFATNNSPAAMRLTIKRKSDNAVVWILDCESGFGREVLLNNTAPQKVPVDATNPLKPRLTTYDVDVQYPYTE